MFRRIQRIPYCSMPPSILILLLKTSPAFHPLDALPNLPDSKDAAFMIEHYKLRALCVTDKAQ
jgi:hypothetical protein